MQGLLGQAGGAPQAPQGQQQSADDFGDPALVEAIDFMGERLYEDGLADEIAQTLEQSPTSMPKILAQIAYKLAQSADTETEGEIAEENLSILGMVALNEIMTLADAAGMPLEPADASAAMKEMVILFAQDNGIPADEISQALAGINNQEMAMAAQATPDDFDSQIPDEDSDVGDGIESEFGARQEA
jgi:hypothetical protein